MVELLSAKELSFGVFARYVLFSVSCWVTVSLISLVAVGYVSLWPSSTHQFLCIVRCVFSKRSSMVLDF